MKIVKKFHTEEPIPEGAVFLSTVTQKIYAYSYNKEWGQEDKNHINMVKEITEKIFHFFLVDEDDEDQGKIGE